MHWGTCRCNGHSDTIRCKPVDKMPGSCRPPIGRSAGQYFSSVRQVLTTCTSCCSRDPPLACFKSSAKVEPSADAIPHAMLLCWATPGTTYQSGGRMLAACRGLWRSPLDTAELSSLIHWPKQLDFGFHAWITSHAILMACPESYTENSS